MLPEGIYPIGHDKTLSFPKYFASNSDHNIGKTETSFIRKQLSRRTAKYARDLSCNTSLIVMFELVAF